MDLNSKADMLTFPIGSFAVKNPKHYYFSDRDFISKLAV